MASSVVDDDDSHPLTQAQQPVTNADVVPAGLLRLPQELYHAIFLEYFRSIVLVYHNDGHQASLEPARCCSPHALAVLRACKRLYYTARPLLQTHATVIVHCAPRHFDRDARLRGSPFWDYTRGLRFLHAHGVGVDVDVDFLFIGLAPNLRSFLYWNEAYVLRDLLHMWPAAETVTLGDNSLTLNLPRTIPAGSAVSPDLIFKKLIIACLTSVFTAHGTIVHALRQHGIGQNVTFLIRFRIQVLAWCERDQKDVQRDICHGTINSDTGLIEYHQAISFPAQQLPQYAMAALVDPCLQPDAAAGIRPLPSGRSAPSFNQIWAALRASRMRSTN